MAVPLFKQSVRDSSAHSGSSMQELVALSVMGDSMAPTISPGDLVLCQPLENPADIVDHEIYAVITSHGVWIKRIERCCDLDGRCTHLLLASDNQKSYKPFIISTREVMRLMKVTRKLSGIG